MQIRIVAVGKLKEALWTAAAKEYTQRIKKYARLEILELPEEKSFEPLNQAGELRVKQKEGDRILKALGERERVIVLDIEGKKLHSLAFAAYIHQAMSQGEARLTFVIGGSSGVSAEVLQRANLRLSFSDMTFPHQLMRIILLEQLYRAWKILKNEPYHR